LTDSEKDVIDSENDESCRCRYLDCLERFVTEGNIEVAERELIIQVSRVVRRLCGPDSPQSQKHPKPTKFSTDAYLHTAVAMCV
jgi:hypothetical protein